MNICKLDKCNNTAHAKALCQKHYRRVQRNGKIVPKSGFKKDSDLSPLEKFELSFEPVTESGCWIWKGAGNGQGYGRFFYNNRRRMAHVASYEFYRGIIPKGILVCHKCDNPVCVNPDHLFLGTIYDNNADKVTKGRHACQKAYTNSNAKLSKDDIIRLVELFNKGYGIEKLVTEFKVSRSTVQRSIRKYSENGIYSDLICA